ncbi:unnamed protein product [Dovyalis caffra]|uniref:Uncharacterized protein n=1 Tax=Dovyalis caffra TaxID=77055 RepID=A0AAV1SRU4_9ROSI|nr:unnamed protein product [Dovyalis caffra]
MGDFRLLAEFLRKAGHNNVLLKQVAHELDPCGQGQIQVLTRASFRRRNTSSVSDNYMSVSNEALEINKMSSINCLILALFVALSFSGGESARHLLQLPKPTMPPLPSIPTLPTLPTTQPSLPKPTLPPLPSLPTMPTLPKVTLPPLPSMPSIPTTIPSIPFLSPPPGN